MRGFFNNKFSDIEPFDTAADALTLLQDFVKGSVLCNATYFAINVPTPEGKIGYALSTYSDEWHARYFEKRYQELDPIVERGLSQIVPFDWSADKNSSELVRTFFGEANEFGVAKNGFSVPIRGVGGDRSLFSINSDLSQLEWKRFLKENKKDIMLAAFYFHMGVSEIGNRSVGRIELSPRERETLKWLAAGKTGWEAAKIMSVSDRTIEFYLKNIRTKMRASNTMQAVARASIMGCIY